MSEEAKPGAGAPEGERRKLRVTTPRKAGVVGKAVEAVAAPLSALQLPQLDWKVVSWGLLVLIAIILVARNWAPVRINIFGWYLDVPKALAFAIFFVLGGLSMWLIDSRNARRRAQACREATAQGSHQDAEEHILAEAQGACDAEMAEGAAEEVSPSTAGSGE